MPEFTHRPPRIQPELPVNEVVIPNPPSTGTTGGQSLIQVALPLVTIIGYVFVSATGQGRSMLLLIPMGLSVVASTSVALIGFFRSIREEARQKREYDQRLGEMRKEMTAAHEIQRSFYHYNYPDPDIVLKIAGDRESNRYGLRLWERRTDDSDFGAIRLGIGTRRSTVTYALSSVSETESSSQLKDALKLQEDSKYVTDVPITIPLRQFIKSDSDGMIRSEHKDKEIPGDKSIQARFAIGIAGNETGPMYDFIRAVMAHYTAFHAPTDTRLYVIGAPDADSHWDWARWLPHTNTSRNTQGIGDQLNFDPEKSRRFWDDLQAELERRRMRLEDKDSDTDPTLPHLLVVVDGLTRNKEVSPMNGVQAEAAVTIILQNGPQLGASLLFIVPERAQVPSECRSVIEVERVESGISFRYAETGVNTMRFVGMADQLDPQRAEQDFARKLAPLAVRTTFGGDLARAVNLLEMHGADTVEQVPILENWRRSRRPENSEWLRAPIGVMPANKLRELYFAADGDGVHGMIAGTTGSGKSELLLTLIVELAAKYDPSVINFVLVDYKGGAAFDPFINLPHAVDIVTNLQGSAGLRTFTALRSELNRRSKLIADTNVKHIVHYRQKGLHETREPFPFLFIIVDEFAEMVKENPDFKAQMDSITRLGRALGVTLITATQRPAGAVTDQMRANMKFRICLRVETMEDSRELLRRSDAAFLPPDIPGRAYVQVGNENVELIQVARAGGPYTGPDIDTEPPVIWLNRQTSKDQARRAGPLEEAPALSDVMVEIMYRLSQENDDVALQKKPWPDPLPAILPLDAEYIGDEEERNPLLPLNPAVRAWLRGEGEWQGVDWQEDAMRATIGLIDRPIRAEQLHLTLDLTRGHAAVFGASGWGKTVFLRTVIMSLAATHAPDEMQVYILDFGGRGLDVLEALPHRGAAIMPSEEERVERLLRKLERILEERNARLSEARADSLSAYNAARPREERLPAVLLVIDNFAEFKENFENLLPQLIGIAREGRSYGVHLIVTAEQTSAVPGKLFSLITERYALKLADKAEYANIVGRGVPGVDDIEGRGYVAIERSPLEFQTALPVSITAEDESEGLDDTSKLEALTQIMNRAWTGKRPEGIDVLRALIPLRGVLPEIGQADPSKVLVTLGIEDLDLTPAQLDLQQRGPHFVIIGPPLSGKTTTLRAFALALANNYAPEQVAMVLIDFQQRFFKYGGEHTLGDLPHVLEVISEKEELTAMVEKLAYEFAERPADVKRPAIFVMADNYDDFSNVVGAPTRATEYKDLADMARKFGPAGLHLVMCGSTGIMRSMDDMMKQVVAPRYGFGLDASESVGALGGRVRSGGTEEFPPGRGYVVKAGRLSLIQTAIPYDESDLERSLDAWVEDIVAHYPNRAQWWIEINPPPEPEPEEDEAAAATETAGVTAK